VAATLTEAERKKLVSDNLGYVRALAIDVARKLPPGASLDDLIGYGSKGLMEAAERFDPSRGAAFTTFAYYRIRGAIFDGLRHMSWFGRAEQSVESRFESRANDILAAAASQDAAQRADTPQAESVESNLQDAARVLADLSVVFVSALEGFEPVSYERRIDDDDVPRPQLQKALAKLPEREREVLRLHYVMDLDLNEVGEKLGLSRSWTSRIHARAIQLLREELDR
jgi:RNA polymerase sigma factor FliA